MIGAPIRWDARAAMQRVAASFVSILLLVALAHGSRVFAQSAVDGFDPEPDGSICSVALQSDGKVLASGSFSVIGGGIRSVLARLQPNGTLDDSYFPSVDGDVDSMQVQPDGKLLMTGSFTNVNSLTRNLVARLNDDGGLDLTFDSALDGAGEPSVWASALQSDGKLLIAGSFATTAGGARVNLARLRADGSLDPTFNESVVDTENAIFAVAVQNDGRVLVGGNFGAIGASKIGGLARLSDRGVPDETFDLQLDGSVFALARQADGKILIAGSFTLVQGNGRPHVARLNADGTLDPTFAAGGMGGFNIWSVASQPDGKIIIYGDFTTVGGFARQYIARLNYDGSVDATANYPGLDANTFCPQTLAPQPDGKLLVGGTFTTIGGRAIAKLARINPDGTVDATFDPDANAEVQSISVQPDGSIFAGGKFTTIGGQKIGNLAHINSDGSPNTSFDFGVGGINGDETWVATIVSQANGGNIIGGAFDIAGREPRANLARFRAENLIDLDFNPGVEGQVNALLEQPDGKILIGGALDRIGGIFRHAIGRVGADGSVDLEFDPNIGGIVYALAQQPDGAILIGGDIHRVGETDRTALARVDSGGHLDIGFNPGIHGIVYAIALQPDGKLLLGGDFDRVDGESRANLARLNGDATIDIGFNPGAAGAVKSLALQADGNIAVGGEFTQIDGHNIQYMARLNSGGHVDIGFNPGVRGQVSSVAAQTDGKTLAGGLFEQVGDEIRDHFARLTASSPSPQRIETTPRSVAWMRSGPAPELERAWFDRSFDGVDWQPLGIAARIAGGWMLDGIDLPLDEPVWIRARGIARGGLYGSSSSLLEDIQQTTIANSLFENGFD